MKLLNSTIAGAVAAIFMSISAGTANAAVVQYSDYSDFQSTTATSDTGTSILSSSNFSTNASFATNAGDSAAASFGGDLTISGFSAFEIGLTFGNDDPNCCGFSPIFDVTLSIFDGATLLDSIIVVSNGNDLNDQFIGLSSTVAFDNISLSYANPELAEFITRVDLGYDNVGGAVPLPASLPLLLSVLGGAALMRRRKP